MLKDRYRWNKQENSYNVSRSDIMYKTPHLRQAADVASKYSPLLHVPLETQVAGSVVDMLSEARQDVHVGVSVVPSRREHEPQPKGQATDQLREPSRRVEAYPDNSHLHP